mmetsp:Transcript_36226/g.41262  ORF Transcript_36226/g.41262 Transcript_36226/m.41262 type:complete len:138 (-) Transcript_36226:3412-3825(-)
MRERESSPTIGFLFRCLLVFLGLLYMISSALLWCFILFLQCLLLSRFDYFLFCENKIPQEQRTLKIKTKKKKDVEKAKRRAGEKTANEQTNQRPQRLKSKINPVTQGAVVVNVDVCKGNNNEKDRNMGAGDNKKWKG